MLLAMTKLSENYTQLGKLFASLEEARFEQGKDFGENITGCFKWFISPPAVIFLERRFNPHWIAIKNNHNFSWKMEDWEGYRAKAVDLSLIL